MHVYFSTVVRYAPIAHGGGVFLVDWSTKEVLARQPIRPTNPEVETGNVRGGARGGRGILVTESEVLVASYHSFEVFDHSLTCRLRQVSAPLLVDVHEVTWDGAREGMWASSTAIDAAVRLDRQGRILESWWPREDPVTAKRFGLSPLSIDKKSDNRTRFLNLVNSAQSHVHLNAVTMFEGRPLVALNQFGALVRLNPTEVLVQDEAIVGCHNVIVTDCGSILVCNTQNRSLDVYNGKGGLQSRIDLAGFSVTKDVLRRAWWCTARTWLAKHGRPYRLWNRLFGMGRTPRPIFVRGLDLTPRGTVLIGISPAGILELDWRNGKLIDSCMFSHDVKVCVHGVACVPGARALPIHEEAGPLEHAAQAT